MMLSNDELKELFCGALYFTETDDGYLWPQQYIPEQVEYFKNMGEFFCVRSTASSSKTIEFLSNATEISFEYKILHVGSLDTFEIFADGMVQQIEYLKDLPEEGRLAFTLPEGEKKICIYLPADATAVVKNFSVNAPVSKVQKKAKILWMGDSITQGFGPYRSAETYVSVANRVLGCEVLNQGIGGYMYDKNVLMQMGDYRPDRIILAHGTNQHKAETMQDAEEYYERLAELYPDIPVLCITPLWRGDAQVDYEKLLRFSKGLKKICEKYPNVSVVDGFSLVPHLPEYFHDNLHPNALGSVIYGKNLVDKIKELKFI